MAKLEAQCSAVGSFGYANYFKLYVDLTESINGNVNTVTYNVYCQSSGSGSIDADHQLYFELGGNVIKNETVHVDVSSPNAYIHIASGTTTYTYDGDFQVWVGASIKAKNYGVSASIGQLWTLTPIVRNFTSTPTISLKSKTLNSITIAWSTSETCDRVDYNLSGSSVTSAWIGSATSGTITISNLKPNTSYNIYVWCRRKDSQLGMISSTISATTYDIARISSLANFEHGSSPTVTITNPASISSLTLVMKIGDTQILSRTVKAGNNTISFSDTELDNLYKKYGSSNSLTATFVLSGSGYTNSKTCTVTLKGNQKTMRTNVSSSWKRGKLWTNVNGTWKRGVLWTNVNGTWKRGI